MHNIVYNMAMCVFNVNTKRDSFFELHMLQLCQDNCYYELGDSVYIADVIFTFHSDDHDTVPWLNYASVVSLCTSPFQK